MILVGNLIFRCAAPDWVRDIAVSTNITRRCRCFNEFAVYKNEVALTKSA